MGVFEARTLLAAVEVNRQLEIVHYGFNYSKKILFACRINERSRPVPRQRTDVMFQRINYKLTCQHKLQTGSQMEVMKGSQEREERNSVVSVSYGRRLNIICSIRCCTTTSLADARRMLADHYNFKDYNYVMMAFDGKRSFPKLEEDKRHVLADCGTSLNLRPLTWMSL